MTDTATTAPSPLDATNHPALLSRVDAALREHAAADEALAEQHRIENEDGPNPGGWADVDDARMAAGDTSGALLAELRPMLADLLALHRAVAGMAATLGDGMTALHTGGHFTCTEAESLALPLILAGHVSDAVTWIEGHGDGDDASEDQHADIYAASRRGIGPATESLARDHVTALAAAHGVTVRE